MFKLFKILGFIFIPIISIFIYLFYTSLGQDVVYDYLGDYLSQKNDLDIQIESIDISNYPYILVYTIIDKKYQLDIRGDIKGFSLQGKYLFRSKSNDDIDINGTMNIRDGYMSLTGSGVGLSGDIKYSLNKVGDSYKDVKLELIDINSTRLAKILKQKIIFRGRADANITFDIINKYHKRGIISYSVVDNNFSNLSINLDTKIYVNDKKHKFTMNVLSDGIKLNIYDGKYDEVSKSFNSLYRFNIDNLNRLKPVLNIDLVGSFYAMGEIEYDKTLLIKGLSKSLGGYTELFYRDDNLSIKLDSVSIQNITTMLDMKPIFNSTANGYIKYDFLHKEMSSKVDIKEIKLFDSDNIRLLSEKLDMNLSKEVFDNNFVEIQHKKRITIADIKISNKINHIKVKNMNIYLKERIIDGYIDTKLSKYIIDGKLYLKDNIYLNNRTLDDKYIKFKGKVQKHYYLSLNGLFNNSILNINYTLGSHRLPSHICIIENDVNLSGYINGYWDRLHINAKGDAIDGKVYLDFIKRDNIFEDVDIKLDKVHSQKLFTLFGKPSYPHGWNDIKLKFHKLSRDRQDGTISYKLYKSKIKNIPLYLDTTIKIDNNRDTFVANVKLANSDINITKGSFDLDTNKSYLFYKADIRDLSKLENITKSKYYGSIYAIGEIFYEKDLKVLGVSKSYGGVLDYKYYRDNLNISLSNVHLKNILHIFDIPKLLDAKTTGDINYNFKSKKVVVNTKLSQGKFLPSTLSQTIRKKSGLDLEKEIFDNSSLHLTYQNSVVLGNLLLKNKSGSISLRNTKIDIKRDKINAYFDFDMSKQKFSGKIYGKLSKPKVNLDMQKLIEYQMDSQLDNIMGKNNREMIENLPMGNVAKDIGTGMAGSFMGIFF